MIDLFFVSLYSCPNIAIIVINIGKIMNNLMNRHSKKAQEASFSSLLTKTDISFCRFASYSGRRLLSFTLLHY